jgi:MOSC domain-containing protein
MTVPAIELTGIYIYPVKSLRGVGLHAAQLESGRLAGDRTWLLVDATGEFMHQRDYPQMTRVQATLTARGIVVGTAGMPELEIERTPPAASSGAHVRHVRLWRRSAPVTHVSGDADAWFTRALGVPCHLMAFAPEAEALHVPAYEVHSSLQDATPFHLTSEESLADLNARMAAPVPMNRFRPNLVVRGAAPYAEDAWETIAIGATTLRWIKPCTRCVATTTDQETGERGSRDPLLTLARYRRVGSEVVFGHYLMADVWGEQLRVGDQVSVVRSKTPPVA